MMRAKSQATLLGPWRTPSPETVTLRDAVGGSFAKNTFALNETPRRSPD